MKNKGRFSKKNASEMGKRGGLKTKRKYGKKHFSELAKLRAHLTVLSKISNEAFVPITKHNKGKK